ncbi:hypothetical protein BLNAU_9174 [Blattamonas nauphoetae]|uniref:Uncharacterized protein n=1 Tax=Blattamonas nauphoetae TaxID=2049346 RepID=A0ABQ9XWG4_9EUKA|nr:hypothetical protein BLNAU_9174 [Blattamonas nauphoetae]
MKISKRQANKPNKPSLHKNSKRASKKQAKTERIQNIINKKKEPIRKPEPPRIVFVQKSLREKSLETFPLNMRSQHFLQAQLMRGHRGSLYSKSEFAPLIPLANEATTKQAKPEVLNQHAQKVRAREFEDRRKLTQHASKSLLVFTPLKYKAFSRIPFVAKNAHFRVSGNTSQQ